jgi:hypothetical protein
MNSPRALLSPRAAPLLAALLLVSTAGCIPQMWRVHPEARSLVPRARTVAVLPAIRVFEVSAGNVSEEHEEYTAQGSAVVVAALHKGLAARGLKVRALEPGRDAELVELQRLYEAVGSSVLTFAYPPYPNDYKVEHFEYSVGPVDALLDRAGADALLVAYARDSISTTGHKLTSLLSGPSGAASLSLGLIDRKGRLVWFDLWGGYNYDLRNAEDVQEIVARLMENLGRVK